MTMRLAPVECRTWLVIAALLAAPLAARADTAACRSQASSYAQSIVSPEPPGDEEFFSKPPGPPNIMFLLGNNTTMQGFPAAIPDPGSLPDGGAPIGCSDNAMGSGITDSYFNVSKDGLSIYDPNYANSFGNGTSDGYVSFADRMPWDGNGGSESSAGVKSDFSKGFYRWGITGSNSVCGQSDGSSSVLAQIAGVDSSTWASKYSALCQSCMTTKGWFRGPKRNSRYTYGLTGRFLNKYPPKFAIARKVIADVFLAAGPVRLGIATLSSSPAWFDPANYLYNGGGSRLTPACDKALSGTGFNTDRPYLMNQLSQVQYTQSDHGLGEALFSIGGYYADQTAWTNWFQHVSAVSTTNGIDDGKSEKASELYFYPNTDCVSKDWPVPWCDDPSKFWINGIGSTQQVFESGGTQHQSVCFPCQVSSVIIISDAKPEADNSVPVSKMDSLVGMDLKPGQFPPGGVNTCINYCGGLSGNLPDGTSCVDACDKGQSPLGPERGNRNFMDDVAYFLAHQDLRPDESIFPGKQTVLTYTVLFGSTPDPMLQGMAEAGLGKAYTSNDTSSLEQAVLDAINDISQRSTSGSAASLNNVQATGAQSAFIPRFHPVQGKAFWPGDLEAFTFYNEQITKCVPHGAGDLDNNGDCTGIYLLDSAGKRIAADVSGVINPTLPGLYYEVDANNSLTTTRAQPFWSAAQLLGKRDPGTRQVFTVIDSNGDGDFYGGQKGGSSNDGALAFTPSNWATLLPYLGIQSDPYFCSTFAVRAGIPEIGSDHTFQTCAQMLIRYVLGYDVLNEEGLANTNGTYPWTAVQRGNGNSNWKARGLEDEILGDIFHSAPIRVSLSVPEQACDSQNYMQCLPTLYRGPTPLDVSNNKDAYQQWQSTQVANKQPEALVVGANDGMLHVFKADCWFDNYNDPNSDIKVAAALWPSATLPSGVSGTSANCGALMSGGGGLPGEELFAFIPPDLLPKLKYLVGIRHTYFVDGDAMIRDIWVDGLQTDNSISGGLDNKKVSGEYRTVAIVGERTGGTHYFALDLSDPMAYAEGRGGNDAMHTATGASRFLWLFPKITSPQDVTFGETWNDYIPKPPPIGPIRLKTGDCESGSCGNPYSGGYYREVWTAFLSGGNDSLGLRGRGLYMVNAWTGDMLKNFSALNGYASTMLYPFAASMAAFNWGQYSVRQTQPDNAEFWDTATVGDLGGQLWTLRFHDPDPSNWAAARAFQQTKSEGSDERHRFPIYNITTNVPTPQGYLRVGFGTGDRNHLHDQGVGTCGFGNLKACETMGCNVKVSGGYETGSDTLSAAYTYNLGVRDSSQEVYARVAPNTQFGTTTPQDSDPCKASVGIAPSVTISGGPCSTSSSSTPFSEWVCSSDASKVSPAYADAGLLGTGGMLDYLVSAGGPLCYESPADLTQVPSTYAPPTLSSTTYNLRNRFFSVRLFDSSGARQVFDNATDALTYDANRLDDFKDLATINATTFAYADGGSVPEESAGWMIPYSVYDERGSSNPTFVNGSGCIIWNTSQGGVYCTKNADCCDKYADGGAISGCASTCDTNLNECQSITPCSKIGNASQFTYTANYVTGNGGCGVAFNAGLADGGSTPLRRVACTQNCDALPPPAPATLTFIGIDGTVRTAVVGATGRDVNVLQISQPDDLVKSVYDLPVSEVVHDCRHDGNCQ